MDLTEALGLAASAAAAGVVNAVAGGGTLITFPVLLFFGTPPVQANATSTVALVIGTAGSILGFRKQLPAVKHWLSKFIPVSVLGGWIGSLLLTRTSDRVFANLVPYLILFATLLFLAQGAFRKLARREAAAPLAHGLWVALPLQLGLAIYGGYFGAGIGILMLATFGFLGLTHIHEMNALKNLLGSLINVVAAICFISAGIVDWPKAIVMTVGALIGYTAGAHLSLRIPQHVVRYLITGIGLTISAVMFYRQFAS